MNGIQENHTSIPAQNANQHCGTKRKKLTQKRLKELLHYDPKTGIFIRLLNTGGSQKKGDIAGGIRPDGYRSIRADRKKYYSARLAFLYMEGYFPENDIDHINRIKDDDRWVNLRHVSRSCNMINKGLVSNNTSGVTGVSWNKRERKWVSRIMANGERILLGKFDLFVVAVNARYLGEKKYNYDNCKSSSYAYKYLKKEGLL